MKLTAETKQTLDLALPIGAGALVFYSSYKKGQSWQQAGIIALITAGIAYVIITQLTKQALIATASNLGTTQKVELAQEYGASIAEVNEAHNRARSVHVAFYGADGKAWTEDEAQAIATVNQCVTVNDVKLTCETYQKTYGKSLRADFDKYVNFWDGNISPLVKANWF